MKKNKFIILCTFISILIVICTSVYLIFRDKISFSFENNTISYIKDNKDYAYIIKNPITKIEICSNTSTKTLENEIEINNFITELNKYKGYKISFDKVPIGSKTSIILYAKNSSLTLYISPVTISINNTHYKTNTNYLNELY